MNSLLTIAACNALDSSKGFLAPRRPSVSLPYCITHPTAGVISGSIWVKSWAPHEDDGIFENPLAQRGWVFQERLLPPRTLHYGEHKLVWECRTQLEEEGDSVPLLTKALEDRDSPGHLPWLNINRFSRLLGRNIKSRDELDEFLEIWHLAVAEYSHKDLTYKSDRLPAISGLAS